MRQFNRPHAGRQADVAASVTKLIADRGACPGATLN